MSTERRKTPREVAHEVRADAWRFDPCEGDDHRISCELMTQAVEADRSAADKLLDGAADVLREWLAPAASKAGGSFVKAQEIANQRIEATRAWLSLYEKSRGGGTCR